MPVEARWRRSSTSKPHDRQLCLVLTMLRKCMGIHRLRAGETSACDVCNIQGNSLTVCMICEQLASNRSCAPQDDCSAWRSRSYSASPLQSRRAESGRRKRSRQELPEDRSTGSTPRTPRAWPSRCMQHATLHAILEVFAETFSSSTKARRVFERATIRLLEQDDWSVRDASWRCKTKQCLSECLLCTRHNLEYGSRTAATLSVTGMHELRF